MSRPLLAALLLVLLATPAHATPFILVFDGTVSFTTGSSPSLSSLGLSSGDPLHYEVRVDRDADGFFVAGGTVVPQPDSFDSPTENTDRFLAELLAAAYPALGSLLGLGREFFVGADVVSDAFPDCDVLGRLFVGTELFVIDGCGPVASWSTGFEVGSWNSWNDPVTGEAASVFGNLVVTEVIPVPEPATGLLVGLGLGGLAWRRGCRAA